MNGRPRVSGLGPLWKVSSVLEAAGRLPVAGALKPPQEHSFHPSEASWRCRGEGWWPTFQGATRGAPGILGLIALSGSELGLGLLYSRFQLVSQLCRAIFVGPALFSFVEPSS
eukprot:1352856-Pyramimonas_sp.AAC.3